jgi:hypothetical protein
VRTWVAALCAAFLLVVTPAAADQRALLAKIDSDDFGLPPPEAFGEALRLRATWYHIQAVDAAKEGFHLRSVSGKRISPPIRPRVVQRGASGRYHDPRPRWNAKHLYV